MNSIFFLYFRLFRNIAGLVVVVMAVVIIVLRSTRGNGYKNEKNLNKGVGKAYKFPQDENVNNGKDRLMFGRQLVEAMAANDSSGNDSMSDSSTQRKARREHGHMDEQWQSWETIDEVSLGSRDMPLHNRDLTN